MSDSPATDMKHPTFRLRTLAVTATALAALAVWMKAQQGVTQIQITSGQNTVTRNITHQLPGFSFNGETPVVRVISGDKQARRSGFLPQPIVVAVFHADGQTPWPGAPVTLGIEYGTGRWAASPQSNPTETLTLDADANGRVQAFYWLP